MAITLTLTMRQANSSVTTTVYYTIAMLGALVPLKQVV
jgi:hypothetical protein